MFEARSVADRLVQRASELGAELVAWRRDLHRFPETGWTEFRTSAKIAQILSDLGLEIALGRQIIDAEARMGLPATEELDRAYQRALAEGAPAGFLHEMEGGFTGVVGRLKGRRPGPTIGFRFDIDALDINEATGPSHRPMQKGFASEHPGVMHACGHDGHTTIGLGLAHLVAELRDEWPGTVVLIFQPAEEGTRGAQAMAEAGVVDDCAALVACHLGVQSRTTGHVIGGVSHFLATKKLDARFTGSESHAALEPELGHNALLGAATAAVNLHAIPRHSGGETRVNVGVLEAGTGRNVTPAMASMKLEVRGESDEVLEYLERRARAVLDAAAAMYDLGLEVDIVGASPGTGSDQVVIERVRSAAGQVPEVTQFAATDVALASDDAAALMRRVQERGGVASYLIIGSELASGHHTRTFDFDEAALGIGLKVFGLLAWDMANSPPAADETSAR
jgi:aminobenzoyl-glutamate utilization protein A